MPANSARSVARADRFAERTEANVAAAEGTLPPEVVAKLRSRLGDYNFYQRHGIRI